MHISVASPIRLGIWTERFIYAYKFLKRRNSAVVKPKHPSMKHVSSIVQDSRNESAIFFEKLIKDWNIILAFLDKSSS